MASFKRKQNTFDLINNALDESGPFITSTENKKKMKVQDLEVATINLLIRLASASVVASVTRNMKILIVIIHKCHNLHLNIFLTSFDIFINDGNKRSLRMAHQKVLLKLILSKVILSPDVCLKR